MLQATLRFLPEREGETADGWQVALGDEAEAPVVTYYATITAAQSAIRTAFQTDPGVDGYFTQAAEADVLAGEAAAVTAAKAALLAAEGL
jgi:hypothetical protein